MFYEYNLQNTIFVPKKNSYKILNCYDYGKCKKVTVTVNGLKIPFGVESYKGKNIVNIQFPKYKKNNNIYNIYSAVSQLETFMKKIDENDDQLNFESPEGLLANIGDKQFLPSIKHKDIKFDPMLRVHLKGGKNGITTQFKKEDGSFLESTKIKGLTGKFTLELGDLWITDEKYGLTWYLNSCVFSDF